MKDIKEYYDGSAEGERRMNTTEVDMKELQFKRQDVFPLENYVNRLK